MEQEPTSCRLAQKEVLKHDGSVKAFPNLHSLQPLLHQVDSSVSCGTEVLQRELFREHLLQLENNIITEHLARFSVTSHGKVPLDNL